MFLAFERPQKFDQKIVKNIKLMHGLEGMS